MITSRLRRISAASSPAASSPAMAARTRNDRANSNGRPAARAMALLRSIRGSDSARVAAVRARSRSAYVCSVGSSASSAARGHHS